jgi:hypothetical protein
MHRGEVELHIGVTLEPVVFFRFVGVEIVEDDMDGRIGISGDDRVNKIEEVDALAALGGRHDLIHFKRGEQGRGAVALVICAR